MVEIPDDVARMMADYFRECASNNGANESLPGERWVTMLDPKPPTLREQVAKAWCADYYGEGSGSAKNPAPDQLDAADAVLAFVADWLAAQPIADGPIYTGITGGTVERRQRDCDVRLLRGES